MIKIVFKLILGITLLVVALALGPLLMLWALNTLFPMLAIPYTIETWLAAFVFSAPFGSGLYRKTKKD
jgi:hypothetical protein